MKANYVKHVLKFRNKSMRYKYKLTDLY